MWPVILLLLPYFCSVSLADISPVYFCTDTTPQPHVNIEQMKGMWYGIEIISHDMEEEHYVRVEPSCPVIYISDDQQQMPYNPLHKNYNYGYNYGERIDHNQQGYYDRDADQEYYQKMRNRLTEQRQRYRQQHRQHDGTQQRSDQEQYGTSTGRYDPYNTRRYGSTNGYIRPYPDELQRLRIYWDQNGVSTEYHVRYNVSKPGFWFSSGPKNGSELDPKYSHFAGTVQVIKAVGNHVVLTFCHQMPDRQLFTVILSRENKLNLADVHGVHSLLNRKGLRTTSVKKVCANDSNRPRGLTTTGHFLLMSPLLWFILQNLIV